jgi:hypothetical protein
MARMSLKKFGGQFRSVKFIKGTMNFARNIKKKM